MSAHSFEKKKGENKTLMHSCELWLLVFERKREIFRGIRNKIKVGKGV
jgi:hypothetical protein